MALCLLSGCVSAGVFHYEGDSHAETTGARLPAHLAINPLAFPRTRVELVGASGARGQEIGDVRFVALEQRLLELVAETGISQSVRRSSDLSGAGIDAPGFVLQYSVRSYQSGESVDPSGLAAAVVTIILSGGMLLPVMYAITHRNEHHFQVDVRLYRAEEATLRPTPSSSGEIISQYDTAGATALFNRTFDLQFESGWPACCEPSGTDRHRLDQEEGRQMAWEVLRASHGGVYAAMRRALRDTPSRARRAATTNPPATPAPPAASSRDSTEAAIRATLDERAAAILLCAGTDALAIRVRWSGPGPAVLELRDVPDASTLGCVRAAVGAITVASGDDPGELLHVVSR